MIDGSENIVDGCPSFLGSSKQFLSFSLSPVSRFPFIMNILSDIIEFIRPSQHVNYQALPNIHERVETVEEDSLDKVESYSSSSLDNNSQQELKFEAIPLHLLDFFKQGLVLLIPSFVVARWDTKTTNTKIQPTAYLNGVRGVAAWFVWSQHIIAEFYYNEPFWGYHARPQDEWVHQFPIIRIIYSGQFMVTIFFTLSGFVLSYRPLQYVRSRNHEALFDNLGSSVFRRCARLFLPCIPPLIISALLFNAGVWRGQGVSPAGTVVNSTHTSVFGDLMDALNDLMVLVDFFNLEEFHPARVTPLCKLPSFYIISSLALIPCPGSVTP
jgi:hypothetical protein